MKQLRNGDWGTGVFRFQEIPLPLIAPPQPIFFPKFQIFFADFPNSTFLPLARDCASWEPAADISTARFVNEWYFSSSPRFSRLDEKRLLIYNFSFQSHEIPQTLELFNIQKKGKIHFSETIQRMQ